jgi:hypothetical protein
MKDARSDVPGFGDSSAAKGGRSQVQYAARQARGKAQEAAGQAKGFLRRQLDQRSSDFGGKIEQTAQDIRSVGEEMRNRGYESAGAIAEQVAERAEQFGGYLRDADSERILADLEDIARRQPWLVATGGLLLGLAASRLVKAAGAERYGYEQRYSGGANDDVADYGAGGAYDTSGDDHYAASAYETYEPRRSRQASASTEERYSE